jgi:hypothetical protein
VWTGIVGIATRNRLVRGSNPGGGKIFRSRPYRLWGPPSLLYNGYRVSFQGVNRPGRGVDHPPPSSARVKERVELYLYSPSGPSWPVLGRTLRLPCIKSNLQAAPAPWHQIWPTETSNMSVAIRQATLCGDWQVANKNSAWPSLICTPADGAWPSSVAGLSRSANAMVTRKLNPPTTEKRFFSPTKSQDRLWSSSSLLSMGTGAISPVVTWHRREVDHLPPSSTEAKNEWSYASASPHAFKACTTRNFTLYRGNITSSLTI